MRYTSMILREWVGKSYTKTAGKVCYEPNYTVLNSMYWELTGREFKEIKNGS